METHRLVLPADLNQYGFLFGGRLLAWIDEASWIAATIDHPGCHFVTKAMDTVVFHHRVREGSILKITCTLSRSGTTSVTYQVRVTDERSSARPIFSNEVTFVSVDSEGLKRPIHGHVTD
jgi:acyl-CoA hydrolase